MQKIKKVFTNIEYFKFLDCPGDIPTEMIMALKLREWKKDALTTYISCKGRKSNAAAVKSFIKAFMKSNQNYVCVVIQSKVFKPDTVELYYKEI